MHAVRLIDAIVRQTRIGGSTFVFDLWEGHPMQERVLDYLRTMREHGSALRRALEADLAARPMPDGARPLRVTAYVGQNVTGGEDDG